MASAAAAAAAAAAEMSATVEGEALSDDHSE
jgi:hypothetical protein